MSPERVIVLGHVVERVPGGVAWSLSVGRLGVSWLCAPRTAGEVVTSVFPRGRPKNARGVTTSRGPKQLMPIQKICDRARFALLPQARLTYGTEGADMSGLKTMTGLLSVLLVVALGTGPAHAEAPTSSSPLGVSGAATDSLVENEAAVGIDEPLSYVEADSPEEAQQIFERLDSGIPPASMGGAASMGAAARVDFAPCELYPTRVYRRTSSGRQAIGFKPYTVCDVPVASIRHNSELRYKQLVWWRTKITRSGGNSDEARYTQRNIEYYCVGTKSTTWRGTTQGAITWRGKTYYTRVYTAPKTENCKA